MAASQHDLIVAIVNQGYGDQVMEVATKNGVKGGTIINARGTSRPDAESKYGIVIHPEKEIVLILVNSKIREKILHVIYQEVGLETPGQGIAFTTHIDEVVGLTTKKIEKILKENNIELSDTTENEKEENKELEQKEEN
ncbi:MAG: P-II family nitrogen regulator [Acholeplasmatales bacterium]|nr:P-II family nitrogen regulator [Acholeplasmatales bacterium]